MSKGLKRLVIFCLICLFFNAMAKNNVPIAGALLETGDNFVSSIKESAKDIEWQPILSGIQDGFAEIVDFVKEIIM